MDITKRGKKRPLEAGSISTRPIKRKIHDTENYHYKKLFLGGENSDITLKIHDKQYLLHKVFLCQSPYFASIFEETSPKCHKKKLTLRVLDEIVTEEALFIIFGSLYKSTIRIKPTEAASVLAAACAFKLNGLIEECINIMMENINRKTVLSYYEAACRYGAEELEEECFNWLLINYMRVLLLRPGIPLELFKKLVSHPDFFCGNGESHTYNILKIYLFVQENEKWYNPSLEKEYFLSKTGDKPFLCTDEGLKYVALFRELRLQYMISCSALLEKIIKDNIIPEDWLMPIAMEHWKNVIMQYKDFERGIVNFTKEYFFSKCQRKSFYIKSDESFDPQDFRFINRVFRVTSSYTEVNKSVTISISEVQKPILDLPSTKFMAIRVVLTTLDSEHQPEFWVRSKINRYSQIKQGKVYRLKDVTLPSYITVNFLYIDSADHLNIPEDFDD